MVSFTTFIATVLAASAASAEYLGVVETVTQTGSGNQMGFCHKNAPFYEIYSWDSHQGNTGCSIKGKKIASSNRKNGSQMEGCHGGYTNGWSVCVTSYGANVHNGRGQHQRCNTDNFQISLCPAGYCFREMTRKLKCQGVWHND